MRFSGKTKGGGGGFRGALYTLIISGEGITSRTSDLEEIIKFFYI